MSVLQEIIPEVEFPWLHQVGTVNEEHCKAFAQLALPAMLSADRNFFHVCDSDPGLSQITDELLEEVVGETGEFDGPVYASNTGYNFPSGGYGKGDSNGYHSDGCNQVAIVSTSGKGYLHLAWLPRYDAERNQLAHRNASSLNNIVEVIKNREIIGFVKPVEVVECVPGTLVRINQPQDYVVDGAGNKWDLVHGLYNAQGQRISLMFRSYGPLGCDDGTSLRRPVF